MNQNVSLRERVAYKLGRLVAGLTWPVRAPVYWVARWNRRSQLAVLAAVIVLALGWIAGVDYTSRGPGVAFVCLYALIAAGFARFFPWD